MINFGFLFYPSLFAILISSSFFLPEHYCLGQFYLRNTFQSFEAIGHHLLYGFEKLDPRLLRVMISNLRFQAFLKRYLIQSILISRESLNLLAVLVKGWIWKTPYFVSKGAKKRPNFFLPKNDPPYTFYCIFITFLCDNFSQINSKLQKIIYFYNFPGQFFKIG